MVDLKRTGEELEEMGFRPELISRARRMIMTSEYKRRMPLSPRIPVIGK